MEIHNISTHELIAHPLSYEIFGQLPEDRFQDLVVDIKKRGLLYPLEVDSQRRVVCGSQRLRALKALHYKRAPCIILAHLTTEETIREHLIKDNTMRRQLSAAQLYKAGVELERIYAKQAGERMIQGIKADETWSTSERVAGELSTNRSKYERIKTVYGSGDEDLIRRFEDEEISLSAAAQEVRLGRKQMTIQAQPLANDDPKQLLLAYTSFKRKVDAFEAYSKRAVHRDFGAYSEDVRQLLLSIGKKLTNPIFYGRKRL